jgi:2-methylisocitrate lyase-like PEP mutase family enzyme
LPDKHTARFRRLLHAPELLLIPGGFSPLAARMIEAADLHAFFLAGSQTSAYVYGLPDVGIMGREEMLGAIRRVTDVSDVCVFADADTGFGSALNVFTTVQAYIRAGAAGMHIEDQEFPKRSGTASGRRCISLAEAVGKYKAAVAAKNELDPDFVFCARCDLIGAEGGSFEAAVERCTAYVEDAGVDLIWLNTVQSPEQVAEAIELIPGPVMPTYGGPQPGPTLDQLQAWGAAAAIFPGMTSSSGLQQTWDLLNDLRDVASPPSTTDVPRPSPRSGATYASTPSSPPARSASRTWRPPSCPRTSSATTTPPSASAPQQATRHNPD